MDRIISALLFTAGLFLGMLVLLEIGRRIGVRRLAKDPEGATVGVGTIEGAVFGLLALLVAFTFAGAAARFNTRRQLIIKETNAIGTAYLRLGDTGGTDAVGGKGRLNFLYSHIQGVSTTYYHCEERRQE